MDDNWRQVLVGLASGLIGLATGVLVARIGFDHARGMELARRSHDDALREAEDERRRRERWLDRRREVYAALLGTSMKVWIEGKDPGSERTASVVSVYAARAEVELLRPELARVADVLMARAIEGVDSDDFDVAQKAFTAAAIADLAT
jgi:hypothetical protein